MDLNYSVEGTHEVDKGLMSPQRVVGLQKVISSGGMFYCAGSKVRFTMDVQFVV